MATPDYTKLVPRAEDFEDQDLWAELTQLAKDARLDRIKQTLSNFRRKRTLAHNVVKDTRRQIAEEHLEGVEGAERHQTLTYQTAVWTDANKACRALEKIEEAVEYATVFDVLPGTVGSDDEGWVTTSSNPPATPPALRPVEHRGEDKAKEEGGIMHATPPLAPEVSTSKAITAQTITKIDLPKLKDKFSLEHHLRLCERMLEEAEVGRRIGDDFFPVSRLQLNVVMKILGTLGQHKDIFDLASDTAEQYDHAWGPVKKVLLDTHAKRETLIEEYRSSILHLKYSDVDKFCAEARKLHSRMIRLFGPQNSYEKRGFIESLVSRLPTQRAASLISEVHRVANLGAYSPDWPIAVSFDGSDQSLLSILNRLERQEGAVRTLKVVSKVDAARMVEAEEYELKVAGLAEKQTGGLKHEVGGQRPPNSAKTWSSQYPEESLIKVYECWGDMLKAKVPEMIGSFALKTRFRRNPIFRIVALKQGIGRDDVISRLKSEGIRAEVFTPFQ